MQTRSSEVVSTARALISDEAVPGLAVTIAKDGGESGEFAIESGDVSDVVEERLSIEGFFIDSQRFSLSKAAWLAERRLEIDDLDGY